jgi:hypothetical protein
VATPQWLCPGLLGSQVSLARSHKTPPPMIHAVVHHVVALGAVARSDLPVDQRADDQCSCVRYDEYKTSII